MTIEKFIYTEPESKYSWEFSFYDDRAKMINIYECTINEVTNYSSVSASFKIIDGQIHLKDRDYLFHLTEGAINYINRVIKLKIFW